MSNHGPGAVSESVFALVGVGADVVGVVVTEGSAATVDPVESNVIDCAPPPHAVVMSSEAAAAAARRGHRIKVMRIEMCTRGCLPIADATRVSVACRRG
jgi:hypothetical protein